MKRRRIGFLLYDEFMGLDVFGPHDVFSCVGSVSSNGYELIFIGEQAGTVETSAGTKVWADYGLHWRGVLDTLIIPGGRRYCDEGVCARYVTWLKRRAKTTRRIVSVCTGAFLVAQAGLLNGRAASTHWKFAPLFERRFPAIDVQADKLYVQDGSIYSSAGITAGIDLALHLIEEDLGPKVAIDVARYLVVHYKRSGAQAQYSVPLDSQERASPRFKDLYAWVMDNIGEAFTVEDLAEMAGLSIRSFHRQFKKSTGKTPAAFITTLRLDHSRQLLVDTDLSIEQVSRECGYRTVDVFRRAFENLYHVNPKAYRSQYRAL